MNMLDKICWVFVAIVIGTVTLGVLGFIFYILWCVHPVVAILTTLFTAAVVYITRDSKIMPK